MAYVILTVSFRCPDCNRGNIEQLIVETPRFDRSEMARSLSRQRFCCQRCSRELPDGTFAKAHAEFATPERLEELGFPLSRAN
jgi:hypothetical protein